MLSWMQYLLHPPNILSISVSLPVNTSDADTLLMSAIRVSGQMLLNSFLRISYSDGTAFNRVLMKHLRWVCHNCIVLMCEISYLLFTRVSAWYGWNSAFAAQLSDAVLSCYTISASESKELKVLILGDGFLSGVWCRICSCWGADGNQLP